MLLDRFSMPLSAYRTLALGLLLATVGLPASGAERARAHRVPLECSRGPRGQAYEVVVRLPDSVVPGRSFGVRLDGVSSGTLRTVGLDYIFDMATDFRIPQNMRYVPGSLQLIAGTGTPNVRDKARAWADASGIHLLLPGQVEKGAAYTPPSIAFRLAATDGAARTPALELDRFRLTANVILLGDRHIVCNPTPRPYPLAQIRVQQR